MWINKRDFLFAFYPKYIFKYFVTLSFYLRRFIKTTVIFLLFFLIAVVYNKKIIGGGECFKVSRAAQ